MLFSIWFCFGLLYSYLMLFCWFNFLDMKAVKELYERRQEKKIGGQYIFYILTLFLGSKTMQWVGGNYSRIQMKWLRLPVKVLKCVRRSGVYMFELGVKGINNVLDALGEICRNTVFSVVVVKWLTTERTNHN